MPRDGLVDQLAGSPQAEKIIARIGQHTRAIAARAAVARQQLARPVRMAEDQRRVVRSLQPSVWFPSFWFPSR